MASIIDITAATTTTDAAAATTPRADEPETSRETKLFALLGKKDFLIEELQLQNAALRAQLQARPHPPGVARGLVENDTDPVASGTAGQMVADMSCRSHPTPGASEYKALKRAHDQLNWRYNSLEALHRGCETKIMALDAKCRDYKGKAKQWKNYLDRCERLKAEGQTPRPSLSRSRITDRPANVGIAVEAPSADADRTPRPNTKLLELPFRGTMRLDQPASVSSAVQSSTPPMQSSVRQEQPQIGSSQTTISIDEETQHRPLDARTEIPNSSDDEPELISERCLKRRAPRASARQSPPRRIKRESSSPNAAIVLSSGRPQPTCRCDDDESCRCDELDYIRPGSQQSNRRTGGSELRASSEELVQRVPRLHRSASSLSEGNSRARMPAPLPVSMKVNEQVRDRPPVASASTSALQGNKDVLRPLSANLLLLPRTRQTPKSTLKGARKAARRKVDVLSEDGDDSSQVTPTPKDVQIPALCKDDTLDGLLMGHSSDRTPSVPRRLHMSEHKKQMQTPAHFRTPASPFKAKSPDRRPVAPPLPRGNKLPPSSPRPEAEPLRLRDVRTLKLDDFKINSNYLGSDFAFADTLRGRDQRRMLHVCTRSDCCGGAMQSVMAMGGQRVSGKTDAQALDDYLGPQYQQIMGSYDAAKRKETVLQAHVHAFTKQHGKHRQAFERHSTPANFWRTDFPTTQETLEERQKTQEKDRQDVEARYREAMRDGGRWRFRDE